MIKQLLATEQRTAVEHWCRARAMAVPLPNGDTLCRVLGEYGMIVTLEDRSVAPHLALDGYWEIWNAMCLAKKVKPGWNVLDVGANFGYFTLLLADIVGPTGCIEAWEPALDVRTRLLDSLDLNGLHAFRVQVRADAASSAHGQGMLATVGRDFGSRSIVVPGDADPSDIVPLSRLDTTRLDRVDFVKIDVEGHEYEVWRGMSGLLARGEPQAMLMEWTPSKYENAALFFSEIQKEGFKVSEVDGAGMLKAPRADLVTMQGYADLFLERH
jgi:FkbM family methyltransferase